MISVINTTNRPGNRSAIVSTSLIEIINSQSLEVQYFSLEDMPTDTICEKMYSIEGQSNWIKDSFLKLEKSNLWIMVVPEYNGSFPGLLKLWIDLCTIISKSIFAGKKVGLIGIADGRGGNIKGLEHLTSILNYLGVTIYPDKLPISRISTHIHDGKINSEVFTMLSTYIDKFVKWSK